MMSKTIVLCLIVFSSFTKGYVPKCIRPSNFNGTVPQCPTGWKGYPGGLTREGWTVDGGCYAAYKTSTLSNAESFCAKINSSLAFMSESCAKQPLKLKTLVDASYPGNTCRDTERYVCVKN